MKLFEQHPADIANRALVLEDIYLNYSLDKVEKINPRFVNRLYDEEDKEILVLDLEYTFFHAPMPEIKFVIETLYKNKADEQNKEKKILSVAEAMKEDGIKRGIPTDILMGDINRTISNRVEMDNKK